MTESNLFWDPTLDDRVIPISKEEAERFENITADILRMIQEADPREVIDIVVEAASKYKAQHSNVPAWVFRDALNDYCATLKSYKESTTNEWLQSLEGRLVALCYENPGFR